MGKSESVGSATDLFHAFKKDFRLYLPKPGTVSRLDFGSRMPSLAGNGPSVAAPTVTIENDVEKESDKILLNRYVPASVLVNKDLQIIRFRGLISRYLEPASGKASLNLLKMIKVDFLCGILLLPGACRQRNLSLQIVVVLMIIALNLGGPRIWGDYDQYGCVHCGCRPCGLIRHL
jgi:two-component system CheB/CheR fusion protein